jgi:putative SOS response-associated peptidase YedK
VRWRIQTKLREPFGIASIWDKWLDPRTGEAVVSFSLLTINADEHPVMRHFHKIDDEKRTPVILPPNSFFKWLRADTSTAREMMTWQGMSKLEACPVRLIR